MIVVLGASGMLGTAIIRALASRPVRLRAVSRRPAVAPAGVEVCTTDLTIPGELAKAVAGANVIIHLVAYTEGTWRAAEHSEDAEHVNLGLVRELIEAAHGALVIFAGSVSQQRPLTVYDDHKLAAERALETATAEGKLRGITLRLATLFGEGRGVVTAMISRALAGQPLTMWHDGTVKRDLLSVDDAARAFVAALDHADVLAGAHWEVGSGRATSVFSLFCSIADAVAASTGKAPVPVISVEPPNDSVAADLVDCVADPSAFQLATGWSARVSLREGLEPLIKSKLD